MVIKEVTRENFFDLLPAISESIRQAAFVTFDTELTGLSAARHSQYGYFDTPQERYTKVKHSATNFGLLQYGISCFRLREGENQQPAYDVEAWSFYLWPKVGTSPGVDRNMLMQLSSIEFLVEHGFDFNKTFRQGIPFISRVDEETRQASIDKQFSAKEESSGQAMKDIDVETLNEDDRGFIGKAIELVGTWVMEGAEEPLTLPACNGFRRRLLHQELPKRFGECLTLAKDGNGAVASLVCEMLEEGGRSAFDQRREDAAREALRQDIGFRHLVDVLIEEGVPLVGHNCFMDLMHTFGKFLGRLPEDYGEFKETLHATFPVIVDTKYFAASIAELLGDPSSTSLGDLVHYLQQSGHPNGISIREAEHEEEQEHFHDAGYDSLCTGRVFLGLCSYVAQRDGKSIPETVQEILGSAGQYDVANRLFMMQSDMDGMCLSGPEDEPDRSMVCLMAGFDAGIKTSHLQSTLAQAGFQLEPSAFVWSDGACLVRFGTKAEAEQAARLKHVKMPFGPRAAVITYAQHASKLVNVPGKRRLSTSQTL